MVAVYGAVLTAVFGFVGLIGIILLIVFRDSPHIKFRNFKFCILQCLGIYITATIISLYITLRPHFSCYLYYFGSMLLFAGFLWPCGIRCWEYCVNYHIAKVRALFSLNPSSQKWGKISTWFIRNKWCISPKFLNILYVSGFLPIFLSTSIPYIVLKKDYQYDEVSGGCSVYAAGIVFPFIICVFYLGIAIFLGFLMKGSSDVYKVGREIKILAVLWVITILVWGPYSFQKMKFQRTISASFWILMGLYASFCVVCIYPLILAWGEKRKGGKNKTEDVTDKASFASHLDNVRFRNALHDYLKLQFSQENILFYEAVNDWKRLSISNDQKMPVAQYIYSNFVLESGICQVNLPQNIHRQISNSLTQQQISNTTFDGAMSEVLDMMYSNSYHQFQRHPLYHEVKDV